MERRLSAIFAADMVGYSRLMEADEVGTLQRQKAHRAEFIDPALEEFHGRIVKEMGDGILVEFPSVVDAVQCAVIIQQGMADREADVSDDLRIQYRIGINLGDIIIDGDDIFGDGVNVAARLEQLAEPGGVCISGTAYDHLKSKIEVGYETLGDVQVKNIKQAVRAYKILTDPDQVGETVGDRRIRFAITRRFAAIAAVLLIAIIVGGSWWWSLQPDFESVDPAKMALELPKEPSIAVLPFDFLGANKSDNEYLADGLSENITANLAKLPNISVIARNSSFTFKNKAVDVREVSRKFGVRYVLEGSLQKKGNNIRVTAQLIDAVAGKHLWAETYDRNVDDYFSIQDEITLSIIHNIYGEAATGFRSIEAGTSNIAAFVESIKGGQSQLAFTPKATKIARTHHEKALELDPKYARAMQGVSFSHYIDASLGYAADPVKSMQLAEKLANRAREIDPKLPRAVSTLAQIRISQKRGDEAQKLILRAVKLVPNDAGINFLVGWVFKFSGDAQKALPYFEKARRLTPVQHWVFLSDEVGALLDAEEYEKALKLVEPLKILSPKFFQPMNLLYETLANYKIGNTDKARALVAEAFELKPDLSIAAARRFNSRYIDQAIPEKAYAVFRELGIPDNPPLKLPDKPSIAVLPFLNLSGEEGQEYFSDGMTEDLITDLSQISGLFVIARNSVFTYKGKAVNVQQVGSELGVKYVLEGSVRKIGERVRINAQLIDTQTGGHLWASRYDRKLTDIFALQDEVILKIIEALTITLNPSEKERLGSSVKVNPEAYDAMLRGLEKYRRFTAETNLEARAYFKQAITIAPTLARAHAGLALTYAQESMQQWNNDPDASAQKALTIANHALELDSSIAQVQLVFGIANQNLKRIDETIAASRRSIELDPNYADGYVMLATSLNYGGKPNEGLAAIKSAMNLNPSKPFFYVWVEGQSYYLLGNYEKAALLFEQVAESNPEFSNAHKMLVVTYMELDRVSDAEWATDELLTTAPDFNLSTENARSPYKENAVRERYIESLRKAGLR
jgi:adenylate cyclase